jgi:hypothetical protein
MGSVTTMWKFSHDGLNLTTISDVRNFHNISAMLLTFMTVSLKLVIWLPRILTTNQNKRFRSPNPGANLRRCYESPNPGANLRRCYEDDSTDLIYSTVPSNSDDTAATFLACFQDRVRTCGAPTRLTDDEFPRWGVLPPWVVWIWRYLSNNNYHDTITTVRHKRRHKRPRLLGSDKM